jgi:hypothetical protein
MNIETIDYQGWKDCLRISNGAVELIATVEIGPRLIYFGGAGQKNVFAEIEADLGKTGGEKWRVYGGHRLWHAPEDPVRTYQPDNGPIEIHHSKTSIRFIQPVEQSTGIQKEIELRLDSSQPKVELIHRLYNRGEEVVELAPWALSVMAPGGKAVLPVPLRGSHQGNLLPTSSLAIWAYTDLSDPRLEWGDEFITIVQDVDQKDPLKIGMNNPGGWMGYLNGGQLFLKYAPYQPAGQYPDRGSNLEIYTDHRFLELETLGPLISLSPGQKVEHRENWILKAGIRKFPVDEVKGQKLSEVIKNLIGQQSIE